MLSDEYEFFCVPTHMFLEDALESSVQRRTSFRQDFAVRSKDSVKV